jgi:exodeoxyribonuclease V gamma subunit
VLVDALCDVLASHRPADPFEPFPVVVGSRGMERWLRHEVATRSDIAAGLEFPFPRQALAGAARWLLSTPRDPRACFWSIEDEAGAEAQRWERDPLAFRLIGALRRHLSESDFSEVARYVQIGLEAGGQGKPGESQAPNPAASIGARELLFASEVSDVLDRLMHDRPATALEWAEAPARVDPPHRWLAELLAELDASTDLESPAALHRRLTSSKPVSTGRTMCMFGLSTMGPGDRDRLLAIARSIDVHLFVLTPTRQWFRDHLTPAEARAALRGATNDDERKRIEAEISTQNPILASLGAPSRDLQDWLEQAQYLGDHLTSVDPADPTDAEDGGEVTLLRRLQGWILAAEDLAVADEERGGPWPRDASIAAHAAYGPLRQCEVLRDQLLSMFAADPTLEPRDVVVMTPDIEAYAPLVAAVFSRRPEARVEPGVVAGVETGVPTGRGAGDRLPAIPVSIADLGLQRTNPVAAVLLAVLEMAGERVCASWILDFLALDPVRRRWSLDDEDLADIRQLVRESGLRWGMDARDRAAAGQPALDQNTVRFATERLALGVLMPDDDAINGANIPGLRPAVPLEIESQARARRVGRFTAIMQTLEVHRSALATPVTLEEWRARLLTALDDLAATTDTSGWLRAEVDAALDDLASAGKQLGELRVDREALLRLLQGQFEIPQHGDRAITGAVQVCALEPMRSVPFRVVALLGMDDRVFPRGGRLRTWDPMEKALPGERDRRATDRHLMLEAILSARDHFMISWSGFDVRQGQEQPAAVPVEELLETLGHLTASTRAELVREHPLQPWSGGNFSGEGSSHDEGMAAAAETLRRIERGEASAAVLGLAGGGTQALPEETNRVDTLALEDLADGLLAPHRVLLRDRLGLSVSYEEAALEDREPIELDSLESWALRDRMLNGLENADEESSARIVERMLTRIGGEGALPLECGGKKLLAEEAERVRAVAHHLRDIRGEAGPAIELSVQLPEGPLLVGRVDRVVHSGEERILQWPTASSVANERLQLRAWLQLLAARACGESVVGVRLVGHASAKRKKAAGTFLAFEGTEEDARCILADLVAVWRHARQQPLPLFRKTSHRIAAVLAAQAGDSERGGGRPSEETMPKLVAEATKGWEGTRHSTGDFQDRWISTFYVDYSPIDHLDDLGEDSLLGLTRRVWVPLHRGLAQGSDLATSWYREEGGT